MTKSTESIIIEYNNNTEAYERMNRFIRCIDGRCSKIKTEIELESGSPVKLTFTPIFTED